MTWRWVWFRSRLTAIVASALIWIVLLSLVPEVVAAFVLLALALVAGWRTRLLLWWRFGIRRVAMVDAEVVWRALVPFEWLRGRNQPQLRSSRRSHAEVVAADARHLVLSERLMGHVSQHSVSDLASLRLPVLAWHALWLVVGLAAADLYRQEQWPGLVMLLLAAIATVTTPRWNRSWASRQVAMADAFETDNPPTSMPQPRPGATTPRRVGAVRGATPRGSAR